MSITLEQLSAKMRQGEQVPLRQTAQIVLTLSIPSILQQIVVTAMEYIDAAMVGHIGASATASIGIVSSSTWLLHGMLAGLYMSFSIQVAQYLGADRQAEYMAIPDEVNPMMGNRGIRLCLDRKKMFKAQLRAIYRASAYGNISLMYPMITSEEELDEIEKLIQEVKKGLDEKNIPYKNIRTGIMIETPAAVMISEELGKRVDFLSLGTNDLTQYTLAMDRQNLLLKNKYNDHHPALVKMIRMVTEAGHKSGCNVYICGELAADSNLTEAFIQMGVDGLSVVPACVLPVRKAIRSSYADEANRPEEAVKEK